MAPSAAISFTFVLLFVSFAGGSVSGATFTVTNGWNFTVWPAAAMSVGGGTKLSPGQTGILSTSTSSPNGCSFNHKGRGGCQTGDCAGELRCKVSGMPPATLAEYMLDFVDYYDISVLQGFNVPMEFKCTTGEAIRCMDSSCPDAIRRPGEEKYLTCIDNSDYQVVFCPSGPT